MYSQRKPHVLFSHPRPKRNPAATLPSQPIVSFNPLYPILSPLLTQKAPKPITIAHDVLEYGFHKFFVV